MVLINGSKGIGTGFSTDIMCYNPRDIIQYLNNKLDQIESNIEFTPYYEGFKGTTEKITETKFMFKGRYQVISPDKIRVTELPVGFWTQDFKEHLEGLQESADKDGKKIVPVIKDYDDMSKDTSVDFTILFQKGKLAELELVNADHGCNGVEKLLKLYSTNSNTNMNLFNSEDKLKKYSTISEIIDDYYITRLEYYQERKKYIIQHLENQLLILSNKSRYIQELLDETIDLRKKKKTEIINILKGKNYAVIDNDEYKYLLKMPMDSVSEENVAKLLKEFKDKSTELAIVKNTTAENMWKKELLELEKVYNEYILERERLMDEPKKKSVKKKKELVVLD
jgi:DNA topoisomerase-2